jgi:hypothetical protein
MDGQGSIPDRAGISPCCHFDQTGFGAHLGSYPMGTVGSFPGGKADGV